jgi:hypothetical protein
LYDATGKRGCVFKYTSGAMNGVIAAMLGSARVGGLTAAAVFTPALSTDGMSASPDAAFDSN